MPLPLPDDLLASTKMSPSELGEVVPDPDRSGGGTSRGESTEQVVEAPATQRADDADASSGDSAPPAPLR